METTIHLPDGDHRLAVTGPSERNLKILRESLGVGVAARRSVLKLSGEERPVRQALAVIERLTEAAAGGMPMQRQDVLDAIAAASRSAGSRPARDLGGSGEPGGSTLRRDGTFEVYLPGKRVGPSTAGQRRYVEAMLAHDLTFCLGPAGTGKTYLAVAAAAAMLKRGEVRKLVLVRPAVEAGEKLGFLPGSLQDKVDPYLRPLLDALHDMMDFEQISRFMAVDLIEIVPLAFMRGRTLNDACIILDEAQNTTRAQMLMFLTRLGHGGKMIITGDTSQIDLPDPRDSGLIDAVRRLRRVRGVATTTLDGGDIVRHELVQRIVEAYGAPKTDPRVKALLDGAEDAEGPPAGS
ncbi:PhoH family protein [Phycisphaera mikurensis]|uniref:PhoH-like protein n=1 Tax=Phycisphaera mikurensis (strain NBRC 102666 / KCTC 22515 / FYK2301M01) TaxID=1142394 RepID=I0IF74_PHYMF|nr:PhoH family protein [Phycisphaera mikurensis]MBB6440692.1 phosphate starvation-inducible PhoH-like protein [Phycisphaera mikurensis]BAM03912.1 PhoH-like protein [Phycisphaera mikurensis NBRC 102666]